MCAATDASGEFDLYYTTGKWGSAGNSVVKLHDSAAWNQLLNVTSTNTLYTLSTQGTLKGIAFAPALPITMAQPKLEGAYLSNGFKVSFTNFPSIGTNFTVWSTTNLVLPFTMSLPFNTWSNLGHPFKSPAVPQQFYRVTSP